MEKSTYNDIRKVFNLRSIAKLGGLQCDKLYNNVKGVYNSVKQTEKNYILREIKPGIESLLDWLGYDIDIKRKGTE